MSKILSVQEIMDAQDITEKEISIPDWGGSVVVRSISHRTMRDIRKDIARKNGEDPSEDEVEKQILLKGLIQPQFSEEEVEHLFEKSTKNVTTILTEILGNSNASETAVKQEEKTFPSDAE